MTQKVALITGAAQGIGKRTAEVLAERGFALVLNDLRPTNLELGVPTLEATGDISDESVVKHFVALTLERFGRIDVLVNNAGISCITPAENTSLEQWQKVMNVNLTAPFLLCREFGKLMLQQGSGSIVNIASVAGLLGISDRSAYNASKHGVVAISETLHHEFAMLGATPKVSVLCPGWVNTGIGDSERNRPDHLAVTNEVDEAAEASAEPMRDMLRSVLANGMDPDDVAAKVFAAITAEQFWIQTHAEQDGDKWMNAVNSRLDSARNRTNPTLALVI